MISAALKDEIRSLGIDDKLSLVQELWDSIAEEPGEVIITETQRAELLRRYKDHMNTPGTGSKLETVFQNITNSRV